ncbi:MAG: thiol reductant ABC exporter subunit CydC, partial [Anaerolineales bacterium]
VRFLSPLWNWVTLAIILSVAAILSNVGLMYTSAYIISFAALQPSIAYLQVAIVGVRFFGISRGVWRYFERLISHRVTLDLLTRMRVWFYRALEPLLPNLFLSYPSGDLMSRLLGDIAALEPFYVRAISPFLSAIVIGFVMSLAFIRLLPLASVMLVILFLVAGILLPLIYEWISEKFVSQIRPLRGEINARLVNLIQGLGELLVNHRFPYFEERIYQLSNAYGRLHLNYELLISSQTFLMNGLAYFAMWGILRITIPEVTSGRLAGVILAGLGLAVYVSFEAFMGLPNAGQILAISRQAGGRLFELSDQANKPREVPRFFIEENSPLEFEFKKVTFAYRPMFRNGGASHKLHSLSAAVKDIDILIPFGKHIGIIGASGSGKTTLLNLMMGLYQAQQGEILVNGREMQQIDLVTLRRNIASSGQDDFFFHDTLENNLLLLNPHASKSQVEAVIKAACLEELVNSLPDGLNTIIGEQGKQLSGGERKRVLIARTLLREAAVYIFDEPLAQLDEATGRLVLQHILHWCAEKTLLIVSHLAWGLDAMDEIIVMDNGRVVQRGPFSEINHYLIH